MAKPPRRSLERRLPALMGILILVVVGSLSWIAYVQVERVLLSSAQDRLAGVERALTAGLLESIASRREALAEAARRPEFTAYLTNPDDSTRASVATLLGVGGNAGSGFRGFEIWDADGNCSLAIVRSASGAQLESSYASDAPATCGAASRGDAPLEGIGPIRVSGEAVVFDLSAPVPGADGAGTVGYLVEMRALSGADESGLIQGLIGSDADVFVGRGTGGVWTDLVAPVSGPPIDGPTDELLRYRDADGVERLGLAGTMDGTPWLVWVQFPRDVVLAPLRDFMRPFGLATAAFLVFGTSGAWLVGRRIASPLRALTDAAEEIAAGRYGSRVSGSDSEETGRLAVAFNQMAERIEDHNRELEDRVAERTRELQSALQQLEEAQDQLVRREKLATLGQLASGVGHELRNPLGVMSNAVYYLEMVLSSEDDRVKEYLEILRGQIVLSEKIVEDLLDFARVKPPQKEAVPVERLVGEQLERLTAPEAAEIVSDLPPDLPPAIIDRVQIGQVVINLLSNAFQAVEDGGGTVTLRGRPAGPGHVRLEVADTGAGIAEGDLERIFEPLFTTKARGIGLGLAVARSLAEANGGTLTASSRPGAGATFTLTLPITEGT